MRVLDTDAQPTLTAADGFTPSVRRLRAPHDLTRSVRVGIAERFCTACGARRNNAAEGVTTHEGWCDTPGEWHHVTRSLHT